MRSDFSLVYLNTFTRIWRNTQFLRHWKGSRHFIDRKIAQRIYTFWSVFWAIQMPAIVFLSLTWEIIRTFENPRKSCLKFSIIPLLSRMQAFVSLGIPCFVFQLLDKSNFKDLQLSSSSIPNDDLFLLTADFQPVVNCSIKPWFS